MDLGLDQVSPDPGALCRFPSLCSCGELPKNRLEPLQGVQGGAGQWRGHGIVVSGVFPCIPRGTVRN